MQKKHTILIGVVAWLAAVALFGVILLEGFALFRRFGEFNALDDQYTRLERQMHQILAVLVGESLTKVTVYDKRGVDVVYETTDAADLERFAAAFKKLEDYEPNHPRYSEQFYVVVGLRDQHQLEFMFCLENDRRVYIDFVHKEGTATLYFGHASSGPLYEWLKQAGVV